MRRCYQLVPRTLLHSCCPSPPDAGRKLLREDDETPMTMFFGFMGLIIFLSVGPLLLALW